MQDFDDLKDRLPLGQADFVQLRAADHIYVDKTEYVCQRWKSCSCTG